MNHIAERPRVLLTALEGADVGIFILGPDFSVQWINGATERYFGLDREEVIGEDKQTLIESTIQSIFERPERFAETVIDTYRDNTYVEEFECHVLPGDQRDERWLLHQSQPIREGEFAGGRIEHYTDITERKAREQELRRQNKRLETFADTVSHDLLNPLNTASLRLDLLREETESDHAEMIGTSLDRMERIVEDMLWLAREGADIGTTEPVELQPLIEGAWSIVTGGVDGIELTVEDGLGTVEADADRLRQFFENLLANAVEHGGESVTVGRLPDGFYVADDGPGVPEASREDVFASGYSTDRTGTGMGLHIVRQIVEAHGWEIRLTEGSAGGARFEITGVEPVP